MRITTITLYAAVLTLAIPACSDDPISSEPDPNALEYVTPEELGFSSTALQEAVVGLEAIGSAAVAELGIDDIPPNLTDEEKQARVADLLKSRSGF